MAQTLESMMRRIGSAEDLYGVVRVMKALAAANIRQCEKNVESLQEYARTIEQGLQVVLRARTGPLTSDQNRDSRWAAIIVGSDQGMCGSFNEQVATFAIDQLKAHTGPQSLPTILIVGSRVTGRLEDAGFSINEQFSVPSTPATITAAVNHVLLTVEKLRFERGIERFYVFHHRLRPPASFYPVRLQLLPLDPEWLNQLASTPWISNSLPTFTMNWHQLFSSLIRQHLFVSLYRVFAESIASENSSRLAAMQTAEKNIQKHLSTLTMHYHQQRQQSITEELLDIIAGFETL